MDCFNFAKIIYNGGILWQDSQCASERQAFDGRVPVPEEDSVPGGTCNKRFPRNRSGDRTLASTSLKFVVLHEVGHGLGLADLSAMCTAEGSIMHQRSYVTFDPITGDELPCGLSSICGWVRVWDSDKTAIWYLYDGP
jgi:hypothetical protein